MNVADVEQLVDKEFARKLVLSLGYIWPDYRVERVARRARGMVGPGLLIVDAFAVALDSELLLYGDGSSQQIKGFER